MQVVKASVSELLGANCSRYHVSRSKRGFLLVMYAALANPYGWAPGSVGLAIQIWTSVALVGTPVLLLVFPAPVLYWEQRAEEVKLEIVISEPDIQVALSHLRSMPFTKTKRMPNQWGREWVLQCLREALEQRPKGSVGERSCVLFGPGLWAIVVPFGIDLAGQDRPDGRFQIWVLTRPVGTDPQAIPADFTPKYGSQFVRLHRLCPTRIFRQLKNWEQG